MTRRAVQYPLQLPTATSMQPEDYIITPSNQALAETLCQLPNNDVPVVLLLGPEGSGKTHLLRWLSSQRACVSVDAATLGSAPADSWMKPGICHILDGIEQAPSAQALAQAINHARAACMWLLISARDDYAPTLPDLASRLNAAHRLHMPVPDDAMREALLYKYFADLQWRCDTDVIAYVNARLPRDMVSLQQFVARADAEGLAEKRALTIPFASRILKELENPHVS